MQRLRGMVIPRYSKPTNETDEQLEAKFIRSLPEEERQTIARCFNEIDVDFSGSLNYDELAALVKRPRSPMDPSYLSILLVPIVTHRRLWVFSAAEDPWDEPFGRRAQLDFEGLLTASLRRSDGNTCQVERGRSRLTRSRLIKAVDKSGDGVVTLDEFIVAMATVIRSPTACCCAPLGAGGGIPAGALELGYFAEHRPIWCRSRS